jgi:APA family basic amino acid/polyamine antiporter
LNESTDTTHQLKRAIGLPLLIFYGVGTIIGGGFYALTGEIAGEAGMLAPLAFGMSALIALVTAFSFAEMSARFPVSAGEAHYVQEAFGRRWISSLVGWLVILTGIVSAAALANAFAGFLLELVDLPRWSTILVLVLVLGLIAAWGIGQSVVIAAVITVIELSGLAFVFVYCSPALSTIPDRWTELIPGWDVSQWTGVLVGAYLAFYAFIGFEDMVNVAEEVKDPQRNLPRAILISVLMTGMIYVTVCLAVVLRIPPEQLANSAAPFSQVLASWPMAALGLAIVGMLAGINGALIQIIMASRVAYGLSKSGQGARWLAEIEPRSQTPIHATAIVTMFVLVLAIWFPIVPLAKATTTILLVVFALVNASLLVVKIRKIPAPENCPDYPLVLPLLGTTACLGFVVLKFSSLFF